jgi:hypothetical protein
VIDRLRKGSRRTRRIRPPVNSIFTRPRRCHGWLGRSRGRKSSGSTSGNPTCEPWARSVSRELIAFDEETTRTGNRITSLPPQLAMYGHYPSTIDGSATRVLRETKTQIRLGDLESKPFDWVRRYQTLGAARLVPTPSCTILSGFWIPVRGITERVQRATRIVAEEGVPIPRQ